MEAINQMQGFLDWYQGHVKSRHQIDDETFIKILNSYEN
jgi:hypothetical protein